MMYSGNRGIVGSVGAGFFEGYMLALQRRFGDMDMAHFRHTLR